MRKKKEKYKYSRYTTIIIVMLIIFFGITSKLVDLQVLQNEYFINYANEKTVTELVDFAPRGKILDSNGTVLATNKQSYILTYTETDDSRDNLTEIMTSVFKILDDKGETVKDDFELKVNPFRFEFRGDTEEARRTQELRFKKDRGLDDEIFKEKYKGRKDKTKDKLTVEEQHEIDEELLKITPEGTFNKLVKQYKVTPQDDFKTLIDKYKDAKDNTNVDEILNKIIGNYNLSPSNEDQLKALLEQYKVNYKNVKTREDNFTALVQFCGVDKIQYSVEEQRRFMLVKDTLKMQSFSGYKPIVIANNIKQDTAFTFYQKLNSLPGINVEIQPLRYYPYGELGSAFLGYISKISSQSKAKYEEKGYDPSYDYVGTTGLEAAFEDNLKGSKGATIVKLNKQGRVFETLGQRDSYPGQNLQLTINKELQEVAEKALDDAIDYFQRVPSSDPLINRKNANRGAIVVEDVNTGAILALASRPGYDPNMFAEPGGLSTELYNKYFNQDIVTKGQQYISKMGLNKSIFDTLFPVESVVNGKEVRKDAQDIFPKPFFNYATRSRIPPGSTFKPMTAVAALEEGVIDSSTYIYDKGIYTENNYTGKCDVYPSSHGSINVMQALEVSCNYFFYDVGNKLFTKAWNDKKAELTNKNEQVTSNQLTKAGQDAIAKYAWQFGLGEEQREGAKNSTGIEIGESFGQVSNYASLVNSDSISGMQGLNQALLDGKDIMDRRFKPIDILVRDTDSDEVKALKGKFKNIVMEQMKAAAFSENNLRNDLTPVLKDLVEKSPELKAIGYTKNDIQDIIVAAVYSVLNTRTLISTPGNIYSASIGQGSNNFTPLQLVNYISTLVNGGNRYKAHLVDKILDADGKVVHETKPEIAQKIKLKDSTVNIVKEGMRKVTEDGGTTAAFSKFPIKTGGKTGSATYNNDQHSFGREAYGVYVSFAPYDKPQIAVCAVVFDAGHGGDVAPAVRAIYEKYFEKELAEKYPQYKSTFKFANDLN